MYMNTASLPSISLQGHPQELNLRLIALDFEKMVQAEADALEDGSDSFSSASTLSSSPLPTSPVSGLTTPSSTAPIPPISQQTSPGSVSPSEASAAPAQTRAPSSSASSSDARALMNGDYFNQSSQSAPLPDVQQSASQMMDDDGGLLKKIGNQTLKGAGAKGITGGIDDNLAREAGGKPGDIGKNKVVTERALMIVESDKNVPGPDGKMLSASVRHNGKLSGLDEGDKAINGSDVAFLQNLAKDPNYKLPTQRPADMGMNGNDTEKTGGHKFWNKNAGWIEQIAMLPALLIPGGGELAEAALGTANVAKAGVEAGQAAKAGSAAARAGANAGKAASEAGSTQGESSAGSIMKQLAMQTGKEGLKQGKSQAEDQIKQQLQSWLQSQQQQGQSPGQSDPANQSRPSISFMPNIPITASV